MTRIVQRLALVTLALAPVVDAQERPKSLEEQIDDLVGKTATLCGKVVSYDCRRPERTSLLVLDESLSAATVSVAIAPTDRSKFGALFEPRHALANVCATGPIEKRGNEYTIGVADPFQLQVQDAPRSAMTFTPDTVAACDEGVELPKPLRERKPAYSREALDARIQGAVVLEAVVLVTGEVGSIRILRSLDPRFGLDDAAVAALKSWRFSPGTLQGRAVPVVVTVEMTFRLGR